MSIGKKSPRRQKRHDEKSACGEIERIVFSSCSRQHDRDNVAAETASVRVPASHIFVQSLT
jgi:hypothetical protein